MYIEKKPILIISFGIIFLGFVLLFKWFVWNPWIANKTTAFSVKGEWICFNNERFFIKGIGYSPYRPGQAPGIDVDEKVFERDMYMIREAGFNTIRTWGELHPEQLAIAHKYGLKIIKGLWTDIDAILIHPSSLPRLVQDVTARIQEIRTHSNDVIMYLVGNEPSEEVVEKVGEKNARKIFIQFYKQLKRHNPGCIISLSDCPQLSHIDHSFWDVVCFNVYPFVPVAVSYSFGYRGYLEWIKKTHAKSRPFIVSEFGLSVSPKEQGPLSIEGYRKGGNFVKQQQKAIPLLYQDSINAGAAGVCVFEWIDEWWKQNDEWEDEKVHQQGDFEEWFGIIGIEGTLDSYTEKPRPVYGELKKLQTVLLMHPHDMTIVKGVVDVELYVDETIEQIQYRIQEGSWCELERKSLHWFGGQWDTRKCKDGNYVFEVKAKDKKGILYDRSAYVWVLNAVSVSGTDQCMQVKMTVPKMRFKKWETIPVTITVYDKDKNPLKDVEVYIGVYLPRKWDEKRYTVITNKKGEAIFKYTSGMQGKLVISAGIAYNKGAFVKRYANMIFLDILEA